MNENSSFNKPPGDRGSLETQERLMETVRNLCDLKPEVLANHLEARVRRREIIERDLMNAGIELEKQGTRRTVNLVSSFRATDAETIERTVVVSAHYDVVPGTPGANDNASSIAVCVELAKSLQSGEHSLGGTEVKIVFLDHEEEVGGSPGLRGSLEYADARSEALRQASPAVVNLEFVGIGDTLVVWPQNEENQQLIESLQSASSQNIETLPDIGNVTSDHEAFAGARIPAVTLSVMPREDLETMRALRETPPADMPISEALRNNTKVLEHYHTPGDTPETLDASSLEMALTALKEFIAKQGSS